MKQHVVWSKGTKDMGTSQTTDNLLTSVLITVIITLTDIMPHNVLHAKENELYLSTKELFLFHHRTVSNSKTNKTKHSANRDIKHIKMTMQRKNKNPSCR